MAWLVIKDHLAREGEEPDTGRGQWGHEGDKAEPPGVKELPLRAQLYDDDGELYYTLAYDQQADINDEEWGGLYQAYQWGMYWAGATDLRIKGESVYG